jgi:hypothetical protein
VNGQTLFYNPVQDGVVEGDKTKPILDHNHVVPGNSGRQQIFCVAVGTETDGSVLSFW